MSHLLSLSELHAAAPGVLDVVFGPDGDFEGAPRWTAPLWGSVTRWGENRPSSFVTRWTRSGADFVTPEWDGNAGVRAPSLDLRTSAADRVAKLCGLALGFSLFPGSAVSAYKHGNYCHLATPHGMQEVTWGPSGWATSRTFDPPNLPAGLPDAPAFLRALTLALAPNIRDLSRRES